MEYQKITVKTAADVIWPFSGQPHYTHKYAVSDYLRNINIDPFPCIVHNVDIITQKVTEIENIFPIGGFVQWIVLSHEIMERCNAWAQRDWIWSDGTAEQNLLRKKNRIDCMIVFSGKRSNIHPAMTKFLVAHEYGHCVDYWISSVMKEERDSKDDDVFRKEYAAMRGVEWNSDRGYGGGRYHDDIMEIIADDFRVVMGGVDTDFYQHSCGNPLNYPHVVAYWHELREKYGFDKWWPEQEKLQSA